MELNRKMKPKWLRNTYFLKKCSIYLAIREMLIKATLRFHLIQVSMARIKRSKANDSQCWKGWRKMGTCITVDGVKTGAVIVTINVEVPEKAGTRSTLRSNCSALGNVPIGLHFLPQRHTLILIHCWSIQEMRTAWISINWRMDNENVVYLYNVILFSH